jgi:hypothetical protein
MESRRNQGVLDLVKFSSCLEKRPIDDATFLVSQAKKSLRSCHPEQVDELRSGQVAPIGLLVIGLGEPDEIHKVLGELTLPHCLLIVEIPYRYTLEVLRFCVGYVSGAVLSRGLVNVDEVFLPTHDSNRRLDYVIDNTVEVVKGDQIARAKGGHFQLHQVVQEVLKAAILLGALTGGAGTALAGFLGRPISFSPATWPIGQ